MYLHEYSWICKSESLHMRQFHGESVLFAVITTNLSLRLLIDLWDLTTPHCPESIGLSLRDFYARPSGRHCQSHWQGPLRTLLRFHLQALLEVCGVVVSTFACETFVTDCSLPCSWCFLLNSDRSKSLATMATALRSNESWAVQAFDSFMIWRSFVRYFINNWPDLCFMTMQGDRCVGVAWWHLPCDLGILRQARNSSMVNLHVP